MGQQHELQVPHRLRRGSLLQAGILREALEVRGKLAGKAGAAARRYRIKPIGTVDGDIAAMMVGK